MINIFNLGGSMNMVISLLLSLSFFIGILLIISHESFISLNKALQQEYGIKRRLAPAVEDTYIDIVDSFLTTHRVWAGLIIAISAFILLLLYK